MTNQEDAAEQPPAPSHISPFERIRQVGEDGGEYWLGRDLATVLDYAQWRNFEQAIERAIRAARNSGQDPADHFAEVSKMVTIGSGARRKTKDYQLSRYACYLIIQNATRRRRSSRLVRPISRFRRADRKSRRLRYWLGWTKPSVDCTCAASLRITIAT